MHFIPSKQYCCWLEAELKAAEAETSLRAITRTNSGDHPSRADCAAVIGLRAAASAQFHEMMRDLDARSRAARHGR